MKKNNENAATTARVSRASTGATQVRKAPNGEFVFVVIGREYTAARGRWNRGRGAASLGFSQAPVLGYAHGASREGSFNASNRSDAHCAGVDRRRLRRLRGAHGRGKA